MLNVIFALLLPLLVESPIEFGRAELQRALQAAGGSQRLADIEIQVGGNKEPEDYSLSFNNGKAVIAASDPAGAMYGCLELAERVRTRGAAAWSGPAIQAAPWLRDRGYNVFLTLPWDLAKNDTDYDPAALTDPQRWWFQNEQFWQLLLDEMARARLNWLDIHGTWDISRTDAPNLYAYFIQSEKYPQVGVTPDIKAVDLKQLNHVIELAHARGIRVSLMAYEARISCAHNRTPPYQETEELDYDYTREVVEKMIRQAPGLDAIGFRIGESGHGESFFKSYLEAVKASGRDIPLLTRSWITRKASVVPLAAASNDFTVEIKYNGEQWGPPYPVIGGRIPGWYSYSFEDYLSDSGAGPFAHTWPGNPAAEASGSAQRWPSEPYKIVWQVRANGTHRLFPFFEPGWVRQSIRAMKIGAASGFTVEPINTYFPMEPYYIADGQKNGCDWLPQRDVAFMRMWGRLGYDPNTPDAAFDETLRELYGPQGPALAAPLRAASRIIPTALAVTCIGPDHRNHAPELESGGDMAAFLDRSGYDAHVFMTGKEMLAYQATGGVDGRLTPLEAASLLESDVAAIGAAGFGTSDSSTPESLRRDEARHAANMLGYLGRYYAARLRGGVELGFSESATGADAKTHHASAAAWMQQTLAAWQQLSESDDARYYKPFTDRLRMGRNDYHWRLGLAAIQKEADGFGTSAAAPSPIPPTAAPVAPEPELTWSADDTQVKCTVRGEAIERAWLLHKPLPSSTFFHKTAMTRAADGSWTVSIPRLAAGHALAADVQQAGGVRRIPSWRNQAPYRLVPSLQKPTPLYYSTAEALRYLKPEVLTQDDYGLLVVGSRGWNFHRSYDVATQRKILDAVERGMTLLVLQQDYSSGRYPLAWLGPDSPKVENARLSVFDPAGALGLSKVETDDILWQRFVSAPGWEVLGNGGIAHAHRGKGEIWLVQARLMQRLHVPAAAKTLLALLRSGPAGKPVVIVDHDSEGATLATSVLPDFLNAHDIPFVTIGEVIADKQSPDFRAPVAGRIDEDNVLGGKGPAMLRAWLDHQVRAAAHVDPPKSKEEQVQRQKRQKAELMRCLGLDPLPERTPLNARVTGTLDRGRYRIEKLVYESRPGFLVTALLYIPKGEPGARYPVIVNPHGHWQHKKAEPVVQSRLISQALAGYLALVVDSPGWSFEGDAPIERRWEGPHDDPTLTLSAGSTTGIYVWDLIRGLDYLETRPEADMKHIGITGASGGGLATVYAFAADERFTAAVPVCYACSLELQPNNGCLCNHVPGTLQIGDRADILGIRAPAPIMLIGASNDPEFPPDAMKRSGEKLKALFSVAGAVDNTRCQLFESGHDYSQPMREAAMGFFDLHLRGRGDGKPAPEPKVDIADQSELRCLQEPPPGAVTMRAIARERLAQSARGSFEDFLGLNGGQPKAGPLNVKVVGERSDRGHRRVMFTFESQPGLIVPAALHLPAGPLQAAVILISEKGKSAAPAEMGVDRLLAAGIACLAIDARGAGELNALDLRLMAYLGTGQPLLMGWDAARAAEALAAISGAAAQSDGIVSPEGLLFTAELRVGVAARGATASQAALFATLFSPKFAFVAGFDALRDYVDCFEADVPGSAIQPRAANGPTLADLRSQLKCGSVWKFRGETSDIPQSLCDLAAGRVPTP